MLSRGGLSEVNPPFTKAYCFSRRGCGLNCVTQANSNKGDSSWRIFDGRVGRESIRKGLEEAAFVSRDGAFDVLTEEVLQYVATVDLMTKEDWYLHTMRAVVQALMANPACEKSATELGTVFRAINQAQRSRPRGPVLWKASVRCRKSRPSLRRSCPSG